MNDMKDIINRLCDLERRMAKIEAQPVEQAEKQEPFGYFQLDLRMDAWVQNRDNKKGVPFYTAPPKREWVGLTDEEIKGILDCGRGGLVDIKKAEQILKERNNG